MRRWYLLTLLLSGLLLITACGASQPPAPAAKPAPAAPAQSPPSQAPAASPAPAVKPAPAPAEPKPLMTKVKFVQTTDSIALAPVWVAEAKNYFKAEGIEAEIIAVPGDTAFAALARNEVQFVVHGSGNMIQAIDKGVGLVSVHAINNRLTMDLAMSNAMIAERKVDSIKDVVERLKTLKGLTIGVTGPGSSTDLYFRYLLNLAGLNPDKDAKIVAMGTLAAQAVALEKGQIDAFMASPPIPQQVEVAGKAKVILSGAGGEFPGLEEMPYHVTVTTRELMSKDPGTVAAVARALARGSNLIGAKPDEALAIMKTRFAKTDPKVVEIAFKKLVPIFSKNGESTDKGWATAIKSAELTGLVKTKPTPEAIKAMWTNQFVAKVAGKSD